MTLHHIPRERRALVHQLVAPLFAASARIGWAITLTVVGWGLFWAVALGLVGFVPLAAALAMFVAGLALIPFCFRHARPARGGARPPPLVAGGARITRTRLDQEMTSCPHDGPCLSR